MITEDRVEGAVLWLAKNAEKAAKAKADKSYLEKFSKHMLAELELQAPDECTTEGAKVRYALSHPDYKDHLQGYHEAVKRDAWYTWKKDEAMALLDAWRTESANNRGAESVR